VRPYATPTAWFDHSKCLGNRFIHSLGAPYNAYFWLHSRGEGGSEPQWMDILFSKRSQCIPRGAWRRLIPQGWFWSLEKRIFLFFFCLFFYLGLFFETIHEPLSLEEGTLAENDSGLLGPWQKGGGETSAIGREAAGSWLCWLEYVIRTSMNTWIISSIITNRANDRYSAHSIVSIISPTRTHATDRIEGWL